MMKTVCSILVLGLILVVLLGCKDEDGRNYIDSLTYYVDSRVDMCFGVGYESLVSMPCTEKILSMAMENDRLLYYVDVKTELCLALGYGGMARVECTPAVRKLIQE